MSRAAPGKKVSKSKETVRAEPVKAKKPFGDILHVLWVRFGRFGWDLLGVTLIVSALVTLLALAGWTEGSFISPWGAALKEWSGEISYLIAAGLGLLGWAVISRRSSRPIRLRFGQVLALEGLLFTLMALLAVLGGFSLERAEAGRDGGVIGWGLARLIDQILPAPWGTVLLIVMLFALLLGGSGIDRWLYKRIETWALAEIPDDDLVQLSLPGQPAGKGKTTRVKSTEGNEGKDRGGIPLQVVPVKRDETLPPLSLLAEDEANGVDEDRIMSVAAKIVGTLEEFGIPSRVVGYRTGPTVTQFAVEPGYVEKIGLDGQTTRQKVRVSQISALSRDLALALAADRLRIEAPVPGHSYVGIEVPNTTTALVRLKPILESREFSRLGSPLALALGRDVSGEPVVADLARMPHLLVAGTTGSGKSVCLSAIITCLVMNNTPEQLRLAVLDPKMVELARFSGLPHILGKVETEIERMLGVLRWAQLEMDQRYRLLEAARARDLDSYNRKLERRKLPPLPRIVLLIDELADLMMAAPDQTEHSLVRLAQMARATGIHLVIATQRPSTDIVTGLIKANFPARIAFAVASSVDSRVILDVNGAETLLGRGDMLFLNPEAGAPQRAQGVILLDREVDDVVAYWKNQVAASLGEAAPWEELVEDEAGGDKLIDQAIALVRKTQRASASLLQRRLRIGFPRAARLLDELEERGVVGPPQSGGKDREVLIGPDDAPDDDQDDSEDSLYA
jgi:S-DNA-T family DNA segregation ATPase FtsK/SpoIIIE